MRAEGWDWVSFWVEAEEFSVPLRDLVLFEKFLNFSMSQAMNLSKLELISSIERISL